MRDLALLLAIVVGLGMTLRWPFVGVLLWTWFTCMQPHREAFGLEGLPLNLIIAAVTASRWVISRHRTGPPIDAIFLVGLAFFLWATINTFLAAAPKVSWLIWDETWKRIALGLFISAMATNRVRIHAIVWIVTVSLLYYGVKGGAFTLVTGGFYHVVGPANSMIGDNNQLAVALLMAMPLANYLRVYSANQWVARGLIFSMMLTTVSILGSYSRGAYIAFAGLCAVAWFSSRRKIAYAVAAGTILIPAILFMPQSFRDRVNSIQFAGSDASFQGRVTAWNVAFKYARDHFPFGAGFDGPQQSVVFNFYFPGEVTHAAHSIYFEVLGDNGFVGLILYLIMLTLAFVKTRRIKKASRARPELHWAGDLANMIQFSLLAFCLGGAALSLAYYDLLFIHLGLVTALSGVVRGEEHQLEPTKTSSSLPILQPAQRPPYNSRNFGFIVVARGISCLRQIRAGTAAAVRNIAF